MNEQAYQSWRVLNGRRVSGEKLSASEQTAYGAGCKELDASERLGRSLDQVRVWSTQMADAGMEQQRMLDRERTRRDSGRDASVLDRQARHLLGIAEP